jgi:hypothetical protein
MFLWLSVLHSWPKLPMLVAKITRKCHKCFALTSFSILFHSIFHVLLHKGCLFKLTIFSLPINYDASFGKHNFTQPFKKTQQKYPTSILKVSYLTFTVHFYRFCVGKLGASVACYCRYLTRCFTLSTPLHVTIDIWRFWICVHSFSCLKHVIVAKHGTACAYSDLH